MVLSVVLSPVLLVVVAGLLVVLALVGEEVVTVFVVAADFVVGVVVDTGSSAPEPCSAVVGTRPVG